ncbi:hypothetical protein GQ53DRAFT_819435 [Thozetella sp. PMI_491]|nr:hypothetical protein GQ53DRAFT_819435 [Thozetella sp. PMI_491]
MFACNVLPLVITAGFIVSSFAAPVGPDTPVWQYANVTRDPSTLLATRQSTQTTVWCGCGFTLDPTDTNNAVTGFSNTPEFELNPGDAFSLTVGSVVAFACNFGSSTQILTGFAYKTGVQGPISQACGGFIAGTQSVPPFFNSNVFFGYVR